MAVPTGLSRPRRTCPDTAGRQPARAAQWQAYRKRRCLNPGVHMLSKVFPIPLQCGMQEQAEKLVHDFAARGPAMRTEHCRSGTSRPEPSGLPAVRRALHDQAAYAAHTGSPASKS